MAALGSLGNQFESVLCLARQFVLAPAEKRAEMEHALSKFLQALAVAESNLEESLECEAQENSADIQKQYDDLQSLIQSTEELEGLLVYPSPARLESILSELREPLGRLKSCVPPQLDSADCSTRPKFEKPESELPHEFHILRKLCREVAELPIRNHTWKNHISEMRSKYQKAIRKLKSAISKETCPDKELELVEMRHGYRTILKGLKRIESFDSTLNPSDLENGQLELLQGYARATGSDGHRA